MSHDLTFKRTRVHSSFWWVPCCSSF